MKFKIFLLLFILPLFIHAQDAKLVISSPTENHFGQIYGDEDAGYVRISVSGNDMKIVSLDKTSLKYKESKIYKGYAYKIRINNYLVLNGELYMFFQKTQGAIVQEDLYYYKLNTATADIGEATKIVNTLEFDKNERYGYYKYAVLEQEDKVLIKSWANDRKVNVRVYSNDLLLLWESNIELEKENSTYDDLSYYFDAVENVFYIYSAWKEKVKKADDIFHHFLFTIKENGILEKHEISLKHDKIFSSSLIRLKDDRIVLKGISYRENKKDIKVFTLDILDKNLLIDDEIIELDFHPNMPERYKEEINLRGSKWSSMLLDDNSEVSVYVLNASTEFRYYVISRTNFEGEIVSVNNFATRGDANNLYNKFVFDASSEKINLVYMDHLDKVTSKGKTYHGNYIRAKMINISGEIVVDKIWDGTEQKGIKFDYAYRDPINQGLNILSCHVYKKKKEDLVLQVKFED